MKLEQPESISVQEKARHLFELELQKQGIRIEHRPRETFPKINFRLFGQNAAEAKELVESIERTFSLPYIFDAFSSTCQDPEEADRQRQDWKQALLNDDRFQVLGKDFITESLQDNLLRTNVWSRCGLAIHTLSVYLESAGYGEVKLKIRQRWEMIPKTEYRKMGDQEKREFVETFLSAVKDCLTIMADASLK